MIKDSSINPKQAYVLTARSSSKGKPIFYCGSTRGKRQLSKAKVYKNLSDATSAQKEVNKRRSGNRFKLERADNYFAVLKWQLNVCVDGDNETVYADITNKLVTLNDLETYYKNSSNYYCKRATRQKNKKIKVIAKEELDQLKVDVKVYIQDYKNELKYIEERLLELKNYLKDLTAIQKEIPSIELQKLIQSSVTDREIMLAKIYGAGKNEK